MSTMNRLTLHIRQATKADLPAMRAIFAHARAFMTQTGNPDQWLPTYPSDQLMLSDIAGGDAYVCVKESRVVGTFVLRAGEDPTYAQIFQGAWKNNAPYATLHRVASDGSTKGIFQAALSFALERYTTLRIDTHRDNRVMQHVILKAGFLYCGIIHCWNGDERLAYQYSANSQEPMRKASCSSGGQ